MSADEGREVVELANEVVRTRVDYKVSRNKVMVFDFDGQSNEFAYYPSAFTMQDHDHTSFVIKPNALRCYYERR